MGSAGVFPPLLLSALRWLPFDNTVRLPPSLTLYISAERKHSEPPTLSTVALMKTVSPGLPPSM